MQSASRDGFFLDPDIVMLNHASYGVTSRRTAQAADRLRAEIERDPIVHLGAALTDRLRTQTAALAVELGLEVSSTTMCTNATSGAAAIIDSVDLSPGATVVVFATEYASIRRAWERKCELANASMVSVPVKLPFESSDQLVAELDACVPGEVAYVQMSLISSSSAVCFPVKAVAEWTHERGGRMILDAAHGPGHVPLDPEGWGVDAMFCTIHKWYPTLRPVGLLWVTDKFAEHVRPAEVSLTWDSGDLVERFSWPGTFDPIPRLTVDTAIKEWHEWQASGALDHSRDLADAATGLLSDAGGVPTASPEFSPPRLRAFIFNGIAHQQLKETLIRAGIRAWVGPGTDGECILRISTHVYNDLSDVEAVIAQLLVAHREGASR